MSCMSQNFRLFHVSNLSVRNFRIFLLMYPGSPSQSRRQKTGVTRCSLIDLLSKVNLRYGAKFVFFIIIAVHFAVSTGRVGIQFIYLITAFTLKAAIPNTAQSPA